MKGKPEDRGRKAVKAAVQAVEDVVGADGVVMMLVFLPGTDGKPARLIRGANVNEVEMEVCLRTHVANMDAKTSQAVTS